jgi:hypothetical protein
MRVVGFGHHDLSIPDCDKNLCDLSGNLGAIEGDFRRAWVYIIFSAILDEIAASITHPARGGKSR